MSGVPGPVGLTWLPAFPGWWHSPAACMRDVPRAAATPSPCSVPETTSVIAVVLATHLH